MRKTLAVALFFMYMTTLARAGETEPFDPEQPFAQALTTSVLRSLLNQALDALEDHLEITGNIDPDDVKGGRRGNLRFKFYPEGKSKSDQHLTAEGWFRFSPKHNLQDFHLRFKGPDESSKNSSRQFGDVL
jgi:hypothetical protein